MKLFNDIKSAIPIISFYIMFSFELQLKYQNNNYQLIKILTWIPDIHSGSSSSTEEETAGRRNVRNGWRNDSATIKWCCHTIKGPGKISFFISLCLPLSSFISLYLSSSLFISLYLSLSLFISLYLSLSLFISLYFYYFISLHLSLSLFISLYLSILGILDLGTSSFFDF